MTPQAFLEQQLQNLQKFEPREIAKDQLADEIFHLLMSKKFRKYSANETLVTIIKDAIAYAIANNQPINLVFPHGAYKLWRLEESPSPDWAELFAAMYYSAWLKPICEIYQPGVLFEFFVDDLILPKIDNVPLEDVYTYIKEFQKVLDFLKKYQPKNMEMRITKFESLFKSHDDFDTKLADAVESFKATNPTFTQEQTRVVELNAHPTEEQLKDPQWKEKILLVHDAYIGMKREFGYYFQPGRIAVFNQQLASGRFLAVGTTKTSVAKFWVGVGVLKKEGHNYREYIFSPKQLQEAKCTKESIHIEGLEGKNFQKIRVIE